MNVKKPLFFNTSTCSEAAVKNRSQIMKDSLERILKINIRLSTKPILSRPRQEYALERLSNRISPQHGE